MTISPAWATTSLPSTVIVTVSAKGAPALFDVDQELVAEHAQGGHHGRRDGGAQGADGGHVGRPSGRPGDVGRDVVAAVHEEVQVRGATVPGLDPAHELLQPAAPLPPWGALAARLPVEEAHQAPPDTHGTGDVT